MSLREKLIYLPAFMMDMGVSSAILGATFFASRLGASPLIIGIMASVNTFFYVLFCQVFGRLSDRVDRKSAPQIASISFSVLYLFIPLCKQLYQLVILFPFTGLILSAFWPTLEAWIGERGDSGSLMKRIRIFNLSWTGGLMIGSLGGGYIYQLHELAPFYFASAAALCAFAAITIQSGTMREYMAEGGEEVSHGVVSFDFQLATKYLYLSRAANLVSWLTLGIMRYIFPKLIYEMGMEPRVFGILMLCHASSQFIMFFILGSTDRWHYKFAPLAVFQILACLSFTSIWLTDTPVLWAFALILFGLNTGMTYFSSMYYSLCGHKDLGGRSGWHESVIHTGVFFSTLIGGALANYVDLKSPYLFCAIAIITGLPVQAFILRRRNYFTSV